MPVHRLLIALCCFLSGTLAIDACHMCNTLVLALAALNIDARKRSGGLELEFNDSKESLKIQIANITNVACLHPGGQL